MGQGLRSYSARLAPSLASLPSPTPGPRTNPFLPPDPRLVVTEVGPDHLVVLNKYPVFANHLLLITRSFVAQTAPLHLADLRAASALLCPAPALIFYNAGPRAGASQPHRHLQAVPLPLHPGLPDLPLEQLLLEQPPVRLTMAHLDGTDPDQVTAAWSQLLSRAGRDPADPGAYNLLLTRHWLAAVPRRCEHDGTLSVNGLGLVGSLLVSSTQELQQLGDRGIEAVLRSVCEAP